MPKRYISEQNVSKRCLTKKTPAAHRAAGVAAG